MDDKDKGEQTALRIVWIAEAIGLIVFAMVVHWLIEACLIVFEG